MRVKRHTLLLSALASLILLLGLSTAASPSSKADHTPVKEVGRVKGHGVPSHLRTPLLFKLKLWRAQLKKRLPESAELNNYIMEERIRSSGPVNAVFRKYKIGASSAKRLPRDVRVKREESEEYSEEEYTEAPDFEDLEGRNPHDDSREYWHKVTKPKIEAEKKRNAERHKRIKAEIAAVKEEQCRLYNYQCDG